MDRERHGDFTRHIRERIYDADWHPFRPLKVFAVDGEWIMAFRKSDDAIAFEIHRTQSGAFDSAESIAIVLRREFPAARA